MKVPTELKGFLEPYTSEIQEITLELRRFITSSCPKANELIWDNYNAVAIAYSKSEKLKDAFCHIAVYAKHVNIGFNRGSELSKSNIQLEGKGKLIRHIKVSDIKTFPYDEIEKLIHEAIGISELRNPTLRDKLDMGKSIVMSVSEKKIRPS